VSTLSANFSHRAIGVAISDTQLYASIPDANGQAVTREWVLDPFVRIDSEWPSLAVAFTELRAKVPKSSERIAIVLLPPIVQVRKVELPKLAGMELRLLLSRNAAKYFPGVREPHFAGATLLEKGSPSKYLAAAASARMIDVIVRTARDAGWNIATIGPVQAAWTEAANRRWPALRKTADEVVVPWNGQFEVLQIEAGKLVGTRRYRAEDLPSVVRQHTLDRPDESAAAFAPQARGLEILPEVEYIRRAVARRKVLTRTIVGAVAAVALIAAGVLWHARRELNNVIQERAALRASVAQVTGAQNDIAVLTGPVSALERIETNAPLWSDVFVDVSTNLPKDAYILNFRAREDSLAADGLAARGATVFENMSGAVLIDSVRSAGPIRRQVRPGAKPMDQFTLTARVMNSAPLHAARGKLVP